MARTILTAARRAEHVAATKNARAAGVKADIKTEMEGLLQSRDYTSVVIATASTIANGAVDPDVVVTLTGDTFESGIANGDLEVDAGDTALTLDSVNRDSDTQTTVGFTGTAAEGTLSIKVKASGLALTPYLISNEIAVAVPAP
jgi:hypothetical protein